MYGQRYCEMNKNCLYTTIAFLLVSQICASCAQKKPESSDSAQQPVQSAPTEPAYRPEQIAEIIQKLPPTPQFNANQAAVPAPLVYSELIKLPPEKLEAEIIKSFSLAVPPDSEDVLNVRKLADLKIPQAIEAIGAYYISFPFTDQRYWKGREYLAQVEHFDSPDNAFIRAKYEYFEDKNNIPKAMPFFVQATESDNPEIYKYLLVHPDLNMERKAWERLVTIYTKSAQNDNADDIYELAKLYRDYPDYKDSDKYTLWSEKARQFDNHEAWYDYAAEHINIHPEESLETLKRLAREKDPLASSLLLSLYLSARVTKPGSESDNSRFSPELLKVLKDDISGIDDAVFVTALVDYAQKSRGIPMTCMALFALSGAGPDPAYKIVHDETAACLEAYALKSTTREACGAAIDGMFPFDNTDLYNKLFSPENQKRISMARVSCLQNVLANGVVYPYYDYPVLSTSILLANVYSGEILDNIPEDNTRYLQYLVLGATWFDDLVSQVSLAMEYTEGGIQVNPERVCYWSQKAQKHPICTQTCHKISGSQEGDVAVLLDIDISPDQLEKVYMACTLCQNAGTLAAQNCKQ